MGNNLFDFINNCFTKHEIVTSTQFQPESHYMVTRFLSMHYASFIASAQTNNLANKLPSWATGCLLYWLTPQKKQAPRIAYVKKPKEEKNRRELIQLLGNHFCCSQKHAEQYLDILEKENVDVYTIFGRKKK